MLSQDLCPLTKESKRKPIESQKWEENSVLGVGQYKWWQTGAVMSNIYVSTLENQGI